MISTEMKVKLVDVAWDIVKAKKKVASADVPALATDLADTLDAICRQLSDHPDFQSDRF